MNSIVRQVSFCVLIVASLQIQAAAQTQYIRSTSPLPGGGSVTTTRVAGRTQTVTQGTRTGASTTFAETRGSGVRSVVAERLPVTVPSQVLQQNSSSYPYPVASLQSSSLRFPNLAPFRYTWRTPSTQTGPVASQIPTLGQPSAIQKIGIGYPGANCNGCKVPASAPAGRLYPYPVASTNPNLDGTVGNSFFKPPTGAMQPGSYPAAIQLQNMPPGVYFGKGMVGQPTTYVDGQPLRNFLRYISP